MFLSMSLYPLFHPLRLQVTSCYTICTEQVSRGVLENFVNFTGKPPIKQKPTTIELIVYKHSTHTKLYHLNRLGLSGSSQTSLGDSPPILIPTD